MRKYGHLERITAGNRQRAALVDTNFIDKFRKRDMEEVTRKRRTLTKCACKIINNCIGEMTENDIFADQYCPTAPSSSNRRIWYRCPKKCIAKFCPNHKAFFEEHLITCNAKALKTLRKV